MQDSYHKIHTQQQDILQKILKITRYYSKEVFVKSTQLFMFRGQNIIANIYHAELRSIHLNKENFWVLSIKMIEQFYRTTTYTKII